MNEWMKGWMNNNNEWISKQMSDWKTNEITNEWIKLTNVWLNNDWKSEWIDKRVIE